MEDIDIVHRAVRGDKDAFSELIHNREKKLFKIAYMYVKDEQGAMDIVGEGIYRAFLHIKKLKSCEYFDTWLVRIVINSAMDYLRKNKVTVPLDDLLIPDPCSNSSEIELYSLVDKLEPKQKTVVILKYFENYKIVEIADIMGCSESNVKNYLHRALKELRERVKGGICL